MCCVTSVYVVGHGLIEADATIDDGGMLKLTKRRRSGARPTVEVAEVEAIEETPPALTLMEFLNRAYVEHVDDLVRAHPLEKAMDLAVGGSGDAVSALEVAILRAVGLTPTSDVLDVGCGSGRMVRRLVEDGHAGAYLGIDVVPALVEYARQKYPDCYRFEVGDGLTISTEERFDIACMFSVATHLPFESIFIIFEGVLAALRPGGTLVVSFLELGIPGHDHVFDVSVDTFRTARAHNQFVHRDDLRHIGELAGFGFVRVASEAESAVPIDGMFVWDDGSVLEGEGMLGQSWMVFAAPS